MKGIRSTAMVAGLMAVVLFVAGCQDQSGVTPFEPAVSSGSLAKQGPTVPTILEVPEGNRLYAHAFAQGVQIYRCTQVDASYVWSFVAPEATLYSDQTFQDVIGTHFGGPTWESTSGSWVVGTVLQRSNSPDPNAIQWLLLQKVTTSGPGLFELTTYIQRVNTTGGKAPATATAENLGQVIRIPYTAEYYFYRAE